MPTTNLLTHVLGADAKRGHLKAPINPGEPGTEYVYVEWERTGKGDSAAFWLTGDSPERVEALKATQRAQWAITKDKAAAEDKDVRVLELKDAALNLSAALIRSGIDKDEAGKAALEWFIRGLNDYFNEEE